MEAAYLWLNAALYAIFAVLCSARATVTARSLGYGSLTASGMSEYLTIYGGLQVGLAIAFALCAAREPMHRHGLMLAAALYAPVVAFRWFGILRNGPVWRLTWMVAGLETFLLLVSLALLWRATR